MISYCVEMLWNNKLIKITIYKSSFEIDAGVESQVAVQQEKHVFNVKDARPPPYETNY